jgi:asparagine synthase (glutamine-hydrolysing)
MFYQCKDRNTLKICEGFKLKTTIAVLKKRGNDAPASVIMALKSLNLQTPKFFQLATPSVDITEKNITDLRKQKVNSPTAIGAAFSQSLVNKRQYLMRLDKAILVFNGISYPETAQASFMEKFAKEIHEKGEREASISFLKEIHGDFWFIITSSEKIIGARDAMGVQPLYVGEDEDVIALASNRRVLWSLGLDEPMSFPPGNIMFASKEGLKFKSIKRFWPSEAKSPSIKEAAIKLQNLLESSVRKRASGIDETAVAFSGGLDSSLIAFLLNKNKVKVHLVYVSLRNGAETEKAKRAAEELNLPLQIHLFEESDVEKVVFKVVKLIEEADPVKISIGVPFYWISKKTAEAGFKILFAGQGADELFGGYKRYLDEYLHHGAEKAKEMMYYDIIRIHENNIERDFKICAFNGVELRLPFTSYHLAKFAIDLPVEFKMEKSLDTNRKLILRKVARDIGLPSSITEKPKKALQYTTGTNKALKKLAKKQNTTIREYIRQIFISQKNRK